MCGIAGGISFDSHPHAQDVLRLVRGIRHRGPDDDGIWIASAKECILGHARLSIIDRTPSGHQPMFDPETGNCVVLNGEIYNFQSLRASCERSGDRFRSHSDTEVILVLYRRYGVDCLRRLRGMFAFALWDEQKKRLFIARDRIGKKPLNYAITPGGFVFCSEIDPLSRHAGVSRTLDREGLEFYLQLGFIPAPWTIYRGIRKLPPAHYGLVDATGCRVERYWDVTYSSRTTLSEDDAVDGLEEKLTEAVRVRMIAEVPLGALLSGGVDSSLVVALMAKLSGQPVRTYSMGFQEQTHDELPYATQAAAAMSTVHHAQILNGDVEHLLPDLARHYGEPYADSSAVPSFLVCSAARRHVTVALTGDGGDELLGGYPRYGLSDLSLTIATRMPDIFGADTLSALARRLSTARSLPVRAFRKVMLGYLWPHMRSVGMFDEFWNDRERSTLLREYACPSVLPEWCASWFARAHEHGANPIDRMLWYDNHTYLPGDLLVKMDIASMACGLETRSPFLDHEVIEFCAQFPVRYKVKNGTGKYLVKRVAERYFPHSFVHRPKMGFAVPLDRWLHGPLRKMVEDTVLDGDAMAPLDMPVIEKTVIDFFQHRGDHASRLWTLLMYGLWKRQSVVGDGDRCREF